MTAELASIAIGVELELTPTSENGRKRPIRTGYRCNTWRGDPDHVEYGWFMDVRVDLDQVDELAPGGRSLAHLTPAAPGYWADAEVGDRVYLCEATRIIGVARITTIEHP